MNAFKYMYFFIFKLFITYQKIIYFSKKSHIITFFRQQKRSIHFHVQYMGKTINLKDPKIKNLYYYLYTSSIFYIHTSI